MFCRPVSIPQAVSAVATDFDDEGFAPGFEVSIPQAVSAVATVAVTWIRMHSVLFQYRKR